MGWGSFASVNLILKYFFSRQVLGSDLTLAFFVMILGISFSHMVRWIYKHFDWHSQSLMLIIHKVAILALITGIINIFVLYSFVNFCPKTVLDTFDIMGLVPQAIRLSIAYFIWGILYFIVYFFTNFKKAEIINLQQKSQMNEIHLNKLKSQLNPHFMFNAMNVIRALIDEDQSKAKDGLTQLSNILRQTLNVDQKKLISVGEEIKIVKDYLALEVLRFEERLQFKIDLPEKLHEYKIPPMLLQTIVENALKHGIANSIEGGEIIITAKEGLTGLQILIENPGQFKPTENSGFGLKNSRERLDFIFNGQAELQIKNKDDKTVQTSIHLPKSYVI